MSFILESLNKSEKKREDAHVPNLHTVHGRSHPVPKKRALWPYLLVAVLLLNAGILLWYLAPGAQAPPVPVAVVPLDVPSAPPVVPAAPVAELSTSVAASEPSVVLPAPIESVPLPQADMAEAPRTAVLPIPEKVQVPTAPTPPPVVEDSAPPVSAAPPLPPPALSETVEPSIYAVTDLPYAVRSRLPELQVSVYAYSNDPAARLVRVNNRILREGSYLDVGLLLEEITPTELIFAFEGYRFRVPKQ